MIPKGRDPLTSAFCPIKTLGFRRRRRFGSRKPTLISQAIPRQTPDFLALSIETRLGDGTYVNRRSDYLSRPLLWAIAGSGASESSELIEARKLIEVELAGSAALRATPDDLKLLGIHLDEMETALRDVARFQAADIAFHVAVGEAGHNRILLNCLHLIRNLMFNWIPYGPETRSI